jgi:hypothetical protein
LVEKSIYYQITSITGRVKIYKKNVAVTLAIKKDSMTLLEAALTCPQRIVSVMGDHAGEGADAIFNRKKLILIAWNHILVDDIFKSTSPRGSGNL